ncbi:hypothetical protein HGRIS_001150 [Hohenbuehelia grisea]|uniref:C2H2-type domain-containing protein n=1 Tax=Hohenbuehelia grisea TaxID=104357 RepID=A0ABR3JNE6_9AGAR
MWGHLISALRMLPNIPHQQSASRFWDTVLIKPSIFPAQDNAREIEVTSSTATRETHSLTSEDYKSKPMNGLQNPNNEIVGSDFPTLPVEHTVTRPTENLRCPSPEWIREMHMSTDELDSSELSPFELSETVLSLSEKEPPHFSRSDGSKTRRVIQGKRVTNEDETASDAPNASAEKWSKPYSAQFGQKAMRKDSSRGEQEFSANKSPLRPLPMDRTPANSESTESTTFPTSPVISLLLLAASEDKGSSIQSVGDYSAIPVTKVTTSQTQVAAHLRRKKPARFSCQLCQQTFTANHNYARHMNAHFGLKRFPCPCGRAFTTKSDLRRHQKLSSSGNPDCHIHS